MTALELLGATLLHFLWQGALIAAVYAVLRGCVSRSRPQVRYLLGCGAVIAMALAPLATWVVLQPAPQAGSVAFLAGPVAAGAPGLASRWQGALGLAAMWSAPAAAHWLSWIAAAWMFGVAMLWLRMLGGWYLARLLRRRLARPAPAEWTQTFGRLRDRLGVSLPVKLLVSGLAQAPVVVGLLRPVVLVPAAALAGLPPEQIEALLLHELAHIRRLDHWVNALQSVVEALLFYHPAVWWVSGHVRAERELCCDDEAVAVTGDAKGFACALAGMASLARTHPQAAVAANGGSVAGRVARLLGVPSPPVRRSAPGPALALAMLAFAVLAIAAQTARPRFEAVSVKPVTGSGDPAIRMPPGRLEANATVRELIQTAYGIQPFQIVAAPAWTGSERYAVDATAAGTPAHVQVDLMLQSLLEDRFRLQVHRGSEEMPVYALTNAPGGVKVPAALPGGCAGETDEVLGPLPNPGGRMVPPGRGGPGTAPCGSLSLTLTGEGALLQGDGVTMTQLASVLARMLGGIVVDRTGFGGRFSVRVAFTPDFTTPGLPPPPPGAIPVGRMRSSLGSALGRLGLRLQSSRGPVDVLVIDHVERPTAN